VTSTPSSRLTFLISMRRSPLDTSAAPLAPAGEASLRRHPGNGEPSKLAHGPIDVDTSQSHVPDNTDYPRSLRRDRVEGPKRDPRLSSFTREGDVAGVEDDPVL
jgi:hypothetical protein